MANPRNKAFIGALAILLLILFAIGIVRLFGLRFAGGDVYPAYSSFRGDPLGTRVLYQSLGELPGMRVTRNVEPLDHIQEKPPATVLLLGFDDGFSYSMGVHRLESLERILAAGGRVVIAMHPGRRISWKPDKKEEDGDRKEEAVPSSETESSKTSEPGEAKPAGDASDNKEAAKAGEETKDAVKEKQDKEKDLKKKLEKKIKDQDRDPIFLKGLNADIFEGETPPETAELVSPVPGEDLPGSLPWHAGFYLAKPGSAWRVLYEAGGKPVVVSRTFGRGTVVVLTDSYLLSNEAMKKDRHPRLLAWLVGPNNRVVFDEGHLGVQKQEGIMGLARRYGLALFFGALVLWAVLYVWKSALPFLPRTAPGRERDGSMNAERDLTEGLSALISRNLPPGQVLALGLREYEKSLGPARAAENAALEKARQYLASQGNSIGPDQAPEIYNRLAGMLGKNLSKK